MIATLGVRHLEIERHTAQECRLAPFLEVAGHVEREPIGAGDEGAVKQISDPAVGICLARTPRIGALRSFEAPQRHGDAGRGFTARGIEDVR